MKPDLVVDIGNSRMKWGWFDQAGKIQFLALDGDDESQWLNALQAIGPNRRRNWAVASVHPNRLARFVEWVNRHGDTITVLSQRSQLPIQIAIRQPESVGIDRLLGAIAANARRHPEHPAVTIDAGTAITLNLVGPDGSFLGGAILPGARLMALALNSHTARLPLVDTMQLGHHILGESTDEAIRLGIRCALTGAVKEFLNSIAIRFNDRPIDTFYTGGNASLLAPFESESLVPTLNLEGIWIAAGAAP